MLEVKPKKIFNLQFYKKDPYSRGIRIDSKIIITLNTKRDKDSPKEFIFNVGDVENFLKYHFDGTNVYSAENISSNGNKSNRALPYGNELTDISAFIWEYVNIYIQYISREKVFVSSVEIITDNESSETTSDFETANKFYTNFIDYYTQIGRIEDMNILVVNRETTVEWDRDVNGVLLPLYQGWEFSRKMRFSK